MKSTVIHMQLILQEENTELKRESSPESLVLQASVQPLLPLFVKKIIHHSFKRSDALRFEDYPSKKLMIVQESYNCMFYQPCNSLDRGLFTLKRTRVISIIYRSNLHCVQ